MSDTSIFPVQTHDRDTSSPWNDVLERYFQEFMAFYFPRAHDEIDWRVGFRLRTTELLQVVCDAERGKRFADCLVQVTLGSGVEKWIYVHVALQGGWHPSFAQRMFVYNNRLYDRFERPIACLVVLVDDGNCKSGHFEFEALGCRHTLSWPVVALTDYVNQLENPEVVGNPFTLITAAYVHACQTRYDVDERYLVKSVLLHLLYRRDWDKQRTIDLFSMIDWVLPLPAHLEQKVWEDIEIIEGENRMRYMTSIEKIAVERGMSTGVRRGKAELIERQMTTRFGPLSAEFRLRLAEADVAQLDVLAERLLDAPTPNAVFDV